LVSVIAAVTPVGTVVVFFSWALMSDPNTDNQDHILSGANAVLGLDWYRNNQIHLEKSKSISIFSPSYENDYIFLKQTHKLFGRCTVPYLVQRYVDDVGSGFHNTRSPGHLLQQIPPLHHEAIKQKSINWVKLYLDVEDYLEFTNDGGPFPLESIPETSQRSQQQFIVRIIKAIKAGIRDYVQEDDGDNYNYVQSRVLFGSVDHLDFAVNTVVGDNASRWQHTKENKQKYKFSFHLYWPLVLFPGKAAMKAFLSQLQLSSVDLNVYSSDKSFQALSLPWSSTSGPDRPNLYNDHAARVPWNFTTGEPMMFTDESLSFGDDGPPGMSRTSTSPTMSRREYLVCCLVGALQLGCDKLTYPQDMILNSETYGHPYSVSGLQFPDWLQGHEAVCVGPSVKPKKKQSTSSSSSDYVNRSRLSTSSDNRHTRVRKQGSDKVDPNSGSIATLLVPLLSSDRATEYNKWCQVGWALKSVFSSDSVEQNVDYGFHLFETFSRTSTKKGQFDVDVCMRTYLQGNGDLNVGSLIKWAREDAGDEKVKVVLTRFPMKNSDTVQDRVKHGGEGIHVRADTHTSNSVYVQRRRQHSDDQDQDHASSNGSHVHVDEVKQHDDDGNNIVGGEDVDVVHVDDLDDDEHAQARAEPQYDQDLEVPLEIRLDDELSTVLDSLKDLDSGDYHAIHRQNFDGRVIQKLIQAFATRWKGFKGGGDVIDSISVESDSGASDSESDDNRDSLNDRALVAIDVDVRDANSDPNSDWPDTKAGFWAARDHVQHLIVRYMNRFFIHVTGGSAAEIVETTKVLAQSEIWTHRQFVETHLYHRTLKNTREIYHKFNFVPPWDVVEANFVDAQDVGDRSRGRGRGRGRRGSGGGNLQRSLSRSRNSHFNEISPFTLWGKHAQGKECRTLTFNPNPDMDTMNTVNKAFNLFTGLGVPHPLPPDDTVPTVSKVDLEHEIRPFLHHLRNIICNEETCGPTGGEKFKWIMKVLAMKYKQPWKRLEVVIVMVGSCGSGKTYLGHLLGYLLGQEHYIHRVGGDALKEQFSLGQRAMKNMFTFLDEFHKVTESERNKFKGLITQPEKEHNEKYVSKTVLKNFTMYMVASNSTDCLRIEDAERRFMMFKTLDTYAGPKTQTNRDYFQALWGVKPERIALYLYHYVDLVDFDPRQLPHTSEGQTFRESLLTPVQQGLCQLLHLGPDDHEVTLFDSSMWHVKEKVYQACLPYLPGANHVQQGSNRQQSPRNSNDPFVALFWKELTRVFNSDGWMSNVNSGQAKVGMFFKRTRVRIRSSVGGGRGMEMNSPAGRQQRVVSLPDLLIARSMFLNRVLNINMTDITDDGVAESWTWKTPVHAVSGADLDENDPVSGSSRAFAIELTEEEDADLTHAPVGEADPGSKKPGPVQSSQSLGPSQLTSSHSNLQVLGMGPTFTVPVSRTSTLPPVTLQSPPGLPLPSSFPGTPQRRHQSLSTSSSLSCTTSNSLSRSLTSMSTLSSSNLVPETTGSPDPRTLEPIFQWPSPRTPDSVNTQSVSPISNSSSLPTCSTLTSPPGVKMKASPTSTSMEADLSCCNLGPSSALGKKSRSNRNHLLSPQTTSNLFLDHNTVANSQTKSVSPLKHRQPKRTAVSTRTLSSVVSTSASTTGTQRRLDNFFHSPPTNEDVRGGDA
jgi:hypothetical protein